MPTPAAAAPRFVRAAVDPALLYPPTSAEQLNSWLDAICEWDDVASFRALTLSCPKALHESALSSWWEHYQPISALLAETGSPLAHQDLVRLCEQLRGRLLDGAAPHGGDVLLDQAVCRPDYQPPELAPVDRELFIEHLGTVAAFKDQDSTLATVITRPGSWSDPASAIEVSAVVALRIGPTGLAEEPCEDDAIVREFLSAWRDPTDAYLGFASCPCELIGDPVRAVKAFAVKLGLDPPPLRFKVAPGFRDTLIGMGYRSTPGRAATCWRTMAMIAAGRAGDLTGLAAHPHRSGDGGDAPAVKDKAGRILYRGYLAQSSPNAHRIFWWSGRDPEFVGVAGHDDAPPL